MDISAKNKLCIGHIGSKMTELAKSIDSLRAVACTAKERFTRYNENANWRSASRNEIERYTLACKVALADANSYLVSIGFPTIDMDFDEFARRMMTEQCKMDEFRRWDSYSD